MKSSSEDPSSTGETSGDDVALLKGPLFCPVGRALDLIGERWTLVLVRHLLGGPRGFQELRARTGIAPRVLSTRLRQLTERGFVRSVPAGGRSQYALTSRARNGNRKFSGGRTPIRMPMPITMSQ